MIEAMKQLEAVLSRSLTHLTSGKVTAMAGYEQVPYFRKLPTDPSINKSARLRHLEFEEQDENATWTYMHAKPAYGSVRPGPARPGPACLIQPPISFRLRSHS